MKFALLPASILLLGTAAHAGELTYQPTNPSFGGNPFNASHLTALAEVQKQYDAPTDTTTRDPLADFTQTVTSRLLSRLSTDIADAIFGENAQDSGTFNVGDTTIDFERVGDSVVIDINDAATGGSTTVTLPTPNL